MGALTGKKLRYRICVALLCLSCACPAFTEQLPIRTYTRAQGLAHNRIRCMMRDSLGFLWLCSGEQLSRFDGHRFTTFQAGAGPTAIIEESPGTYWVATYGNGVCRFSLAHGAGLGKSSVKNYSLGADPGADLANVVYRDRRGRIWAGSDNGLYVLNQPDGASAFTRVDLGETSLPGGLFEVAALTEDREGSLWIGTANGPFRRLPNGRMVRYSVPAPQRLRYVRALLPDHENRLWIGHSGGLVVHKPEPAAAFTAAEDFVQRTLSTQIIPREVTDEPISLADHPGESFMFRMTTAHGPQAVTALHQFSDGTIIAGTNGGGLAVFEAGTSRRYTVRHGLSEDIIYSLAEDVEGHRWLGTSASGAMRWDPNGFTEFRNADGLTEAGTIGIFGTTKGALCIFGPQWRIQVFDGRNFAGIELSLPPANVENPTSGIYKYSAIQDHTGEWWIASGQGVYRFADRNPIDRLAVARAKRIYTTRDGLASNVVDALFEDSRGDVWMGMTHGVVHSTGVVVRWERATEALHAYSAADGLPSFARPRCFAEDNAGNLWVGLWQGGLARFARGRFKVFDPSRGAPAGVIQSLYLDSSNRLWVASSQGGASRIEDVDSDRPIFTSHTANTGLASNNATCFAEDRWRRIYIGTSNGVDRLDPETGVVKHLPMSDSDTSADVTAAFCDRSGSLWFGTEHRVLRLEPRPDGVAVRPSIWISGIRVPGIPAWSSDVGENPPAGLRLSPSRNHLQIDFFGLGFASGMPLRYQYRLEGDGASDWSPPAEQQTVDFAALGPGRHRFAVRAVTSEGLTSEAPAVLAFTVDAPVWRSWWFLSIVAGALGAATYSLHRYRLKRVLELERVRMRIATDLHDDIGSTLSQITVLTEVVRQKVPQRPDIAEPLSSVVGLSRDLVDSLNDIVWAINPKRDSFQDLTHRMRRFASDLSSARGIDLHFLAPTLATDLKAGADLRRETFLIFKESVNNALRHAGCTHIEIQLSVENGWLELSVKDNGRGFDGQCESGNGLPSMRRRAAKLGGFFNVSSNPGHGTRVWLKAPVDQRHGRR
jgi:signal transduction histidine kinase/ligand-binding sensor domain-containing protein